MKDRKHTPGPWHIGNKEYPSKCIMAGDVLVAAHVTSTNAHLIAAAPDLLEALFDFVSMGEQYGWDDALTGRDILMKSARAAIAKAKGEWA